MNGFKLRDCKVCGYPHYCVTCRKKIPHHQQECYSCIIKRRRLN